MCRLRLKICLERNVQSGKCKRVRVRYIEYVILNNEHNNKMKTCNID